MYSSTPSFDSSLVLNDSGSSSTSPSRLPRMLVEYHPERPSMRALKAGASTVFIMVWPVLKSLPPIGRPRWSARPTSAGTSTVRKTVLAPAFKARMLGLSGWYSTNILGNRDGEVLDDPESFKTKEESKLGVLEYILQPDQYPELYGNVFHKVRINYYPPRGDNKEG